MENKSVEDIYKIGLSYLDKNNVKCIEILSAIIEQEPLVGLIIGLAYKGLQKYKLSNQYIKNALVEIEDIYILSDDYIAYIFETIATNDINLGITNNETIKLLFNTLNHNQSHTALLKLSYVILSKNNNSLKQFALENVTIAIDMCLNDSDDFDKSCEFHIICSILVWNDKFKEAEKYHHYFLNENTKFNLENKELIEAYILLSIAKGNTEFIGNLILDFPYLNKVFGNFFDAWYFNNGNILNKKETNLIMLYTRKIRNVINQYCQ